MFGHHYFGKRYFGPHYWGPAVSGSAPPSPPSPPPAPAPIQGGAGFRTGRRRRAEYVNYYRELERQRQRTEEIERLEAQEREALAKAEAAAQALEDAEATNRANAQYQQTIARLASLSDEAERVLSAITKQREQAEQETADEEDAIAAILQ